MLLVTCIVCVQVVECAIRGIMCSTHEKYSCCGNDSCQRTCLDPEPDKGRACARECVHGCVCIGGYFRNSRGECVPPVECTVEACGWNEIFDACANNECVNTCIHPEREKYCKPTSCTPGCVCTKGHVRNVHGECVKVEQCQIACDDPNAASTPCGDTCPATCGGASLTSCTRSCMTNGCACRRGFVVGPSGACVPVERCADASRRLPPCGLNEFYDMCPPFWRDESACDAITRAESPMRATADPSRSRCAPRCRCKRGYVRSHDYGTCVVPQKCCGDPNAAYVAEPNPCPGGDCHRPQFVDCDAKPIAFGCQCREGYVRNQRNFSLCVRLEDCPKL